MPELPEVETIVRQLNKSLKGKVIRDVKVLRKKSFKKGAKMLAGRKIGKVERKSKMLVVRFVGWDKVMLIHLKMTGQLVWQKNQTNIETKDPNHPSLSLRTAEGSDLLVVNRIVGGHPTADWLNKLPSPHTRVVVNFEDGSKLFFNDMRGFGWMKLMDDKAWEDELNKLPPDVIDKDFTVQLFKELVFASKQAIKLLIMDQKKMGGIGNIYANEALFLAGIDPKRPAESLREEEIKELWKAIRKVINKGISLGGASYSDYKDSRGLGGKYQEHFLVYDREGERCGKGKIKKYKLGGRGTYWCDDCQK